MFAQGMLMFTLGIAKWPFWAASLIVAVASAVVDVAFIVTARRQLLNRFREKATRAIAPVLVTKPPPLPVVAIRSPS